MCLKLCASARAACKPARVGSHEHWSARVLGVGGLAAGDKGSIVVEHLTFSGWTRSADRLAASLAVPPAVLLAVLHGQEQCCWHDT